MLDTHRQLRPFNRRQVRSPWHFYPQTNRQHLAHATRHCTLQGNETYFLDNICDDGCKRTICKKGGLASPTGVFRFPSYRCAPILAPLCPPCLPPRVLCLGQAPPAVCSCSFGPINRMMPGSPSKVESMPEFDIWHSRQKGLGTYESLSDVGEIRVWFASKNLTPCRMHWNAFLIAQIIAKCHSFPNMYGML